MTAVCRNVISFLLVLKSLFFPDFSKYFRGSSIRILTFEKLIKFFQKSDIM